MIYLIDPKDAGSISGCTIKVCWTRLISLYSVPNDTV
jgi:hypothetical protein